MVVDRCRLNAFMAGNVRRRLHAKEPAVLGHAGMTELVQRPVREPLAGGSCPVQASAQQAAKVVGVVLLGVSGKVLRPASLLLRVPCFLYRVTG